MGRPPLPVLKSAATVGNDSTKTVTTGSQRMITQSFRVYIYLLDFLYGFVLFSRYFCLLYFKRMLEMHVRPSIMLLCALIMISASE